MSSDHPDIRSFIAELSVIPVTDPLVNLDPGSGKIIRPGELREKPWLVQPDSTWSSLLRTAVLNKREADINSLCMSFGVLSWVQKDKEIHSPLILVPLSASPVKGSGEVRIVPDVEGAFLNPFLKHSILPGSIEHAGDLRQFMDRITGSLPENLRSSVSDSVAVGNFHHHRYTMLREMEQLLGRPELSPLVRSILGDEAAGDLREISLSPEFLTPADADQRKVFELLKKGNVVIQGPPGTGKSQVLTNILGKRLVEPGLTLVVSEKKTALDVLEKKMTSAGLGDFIFLAHSQQKAKDFVAHLKNTWRKLEEEIISEPPSLLISEQEHDNLQLLLNKINLPDLVGGIPFSEFRQLKFGPSEKFSSDVPDLKTWLENEKIVRELMAQKAVFSMIKRFRQSLFSGDYPDRVFREIRDEAQFIRENFNVKTLAEAERLLHLVPRCRILENEAYKSYLLLHEQPAQKKRFDKARLHFDDVSAQLALLKEEEKLWKKLPAVSELETWQIHYSGKSGWKKRRGLRKLKNQVLHDPALDFPVLIHHALELHSLRKKLAELKAQFARWGISSPETELSSASYILSQLEKTTPNELNYLAGFSAEERKNLVAGEHRLKKLCEMVSLYCTRTNLEELEEFPDFNAVAVHVKTLQKLPGSVYKVVSGASDFPALRNYVISSNWQQAIRRFPELAHFSGEMLKEKLSALVKLEDEEHRQFAAAIVAERKKKFKDFSALLRIPAAKLKDEQKELKKKLKAGKSLLVKEFGKTRQHLTTREFLESDARIWIELLCPVWLCTPARAGTVFPMTENLFELVVFDEASQLLLPNALGCLQRSNRAVVAGDEHQMAPASYFTGTRSSVDLLHQADYYWPSTLLKHHYRSVHPGLIAFSNKYFYNDELVAYPSPGTAFPIVRHFVEKAVYTDQVNVKEAKEVAAFLDTVNWKESIGITAFSGKQQDAIFQYCSDEVKLKIAEGTENGKVFFKPLEQVQGDECDLLVVSMGYAKNEEGVFNLRFGPLNQANGYKRLNVLLTRAREKLYFFTSVSASDIRISKNESVNLLRLFLLQLESGRDEHTAEFPHGIQPQVSGATISLDGIYSQLKDARELSGFYRVMQKRGWKMQFDNSGR